MSLTMKTFFRDVAPYILIDIYRRFRKTCCLMIDAHD